MKPTNTLPEQLLALGLDELGLTYRTQARGLPGTPDVAFDLERLAVFVHGCYWHRHAGCVGSRTPTKDTLAWLTRFRLMVERDQAVASDLLALGWSVYVAWECEIRRDHDLAAQGVAAALTWACRPALPM